jgi:hypothetical protein
MAPAEGTPAWVERVDRIAAKVFRGRFLQQFAALFYKNGRRDRLCCIAVRWVWAWAHPAPWSSKQQLLVGQHPATLLPWMPQYRASDTP